MKVDVYAVVFTWPRLVSNKFSTKCIQYGIILHYVNSRPSFMMVNYAVTTVFASIVSIGEP